MLSNGDLLIGAEVPNFRQSIRASTQHLLSVGAPVDAQQRVRARLLRLGGGLALCADLIHGNLRAGRINTSQHNKTQERVSTRRKNGKTKGGRVR